MKFGLIACMLLGLSVYCTEDSTVFAAKTELCSIAMRADVNLPDRCYPPAAITQAEDTMPVPLVHPVAPVKRLTGLSLHELEVRNPAKPLEILYLFGRIPVDRGGNPDMLSHASKYIIVGELAVRSQLQKPRLFRYPAALGGTAYWQWDANVPSGNLSLDIRANISGSLVRRVGLALLKISRSSTL